MHTPDNLAAACPTPTPAAVGAAGRMPLVNTRHYTEPQLRDLLEAKPLAPPPQDAKKPGTRQAESALGIAPSLYFFAGRNFPGMVEAVEVAFEMPGEAPGHAFEGTEAAFTLFDTGGFGKETPRIGFDWEAEGFANKAGYLAAHSTAAGGAAVYLARFLDLYFETPGEYWDTPKRGIDGVPADELADPRAWRHWTMEARVPGEVPVDRARFALDPEALAVYNQLRRNSHDPVQALPAARTIDWDEPDRLRSFVV